MIAVMHRHDPFAAKKLIKHLHRLLEENEAIDFLLPYLKHAFGRMVENNHSADAAFGVNTPPAKAGCFGLPLGKL